MSTTINSKWDRWLVQSINSQLTLYLEDTNVPIVYQDQQEPDWEKLSKWVEISFFGPLYDFQNRSISATIQVQVRLFLKSIENLYDRNDLTGLIAEALTKPIKVPDLDRCLTNLGVKTLPKGRILHPHAAVAAEVTATYNVQLQE